MTKSQQLGRMRGVSLIEVLVTVVVLSLGLLGLAGMQANGTKLNHGAYLRSQATNLAYDMADRMRANRIQALNGNYNTGLADAAPAGATIRHLDLQQWKAAISARMPAGQGRVTQIAPTVFEIEIRWDNSRIQNEAAIETFVVRTDI